MAGFILRMVRPVKILYNIFKNLILLSRTLSFRKCSSIYLAAQLKVQKCPCTSISILPAESTVMVRGMNTGRLLCVRLQLQQRKLDDFGHVSIDVNFGGKATYLIVSTTGSSAVSRVSNNSSGVAKFFRKTPRKNKIFARVITSSAINV